MTAGTKDCRHAVRRASGLGARLRLGLADHRDGIAGEEGLVPPLVSARMTKDPGLIQPCLRSRRPRGPFSDGQRASPEIIDSST